MMLSLTFVLVLFLSASVSASENKTSSECMECNPHDLSCNGSSVIVIHSASYGYNRDCSSGITLGGCTINETNRCCKPGSSGTDCYKPFNITDREELERTCSSKSTCTFNSTRHDQPDTCGGGTFTNSFTLINYTCQTPENKTSSRCWGCKKYKPHYLSCTGSSVIVIQSASYGYKGSCQRGKPIDGECNGTERDKCCTPMPFDGIVCYNSFNKTDRELLDRNCSSKSSCNFKNTRLDQPYNCSTVTFKNNSFTQINYTCQTTDFDTTGKGDNDPTIAHSSSAISLTTTTQNTGTTSSQEESSSTPSAGATNQEPESGSGLTAAGISIGVILAIGVAVAVVFFVIRRRRRNQKDDEFKSITASYQRKASNAANTVNATSPFHEAGETPTKHKGEISGMSDPSLPKYELAENVMKNRKERESTAQSGDFHNYYYIDDSIIAGRNQGVHQDDYNQIEDTGFIQNKPHDGYKHVGFTNTALGDDDYHHIGADNFNKTDTDDTYNHVTLDGKQLDNDNYNHIHVVSTEYNHIRPDSGTDADGNQRFGVIKPEVDDNDNYDHIGNV